MTTAPLQVQAYTPYIIEFREYDVQHGIVVDSKWWNVPPHLLPFVEDIAQMVAGEHSTVERISEVQIQEEF